MKTNSLPLLMPALVGLAAMLMFVARIPVAAQSSPAPLWTADASSSGTGFLLGVGTSELLYIGTNGLRITDRQGVELRELYLGTWWNERGADVNTQRESLFAFDPVEQRWCAATFDGWRGNAYMALSHTASFLGEWTVFTFSAESVMGDEMLDLEYSRYGGHHIGFGGGVVAVTVLLDDHTGRNIFHEEDDSGHAILALADIRGGTGNQPLTARQHVVSLEEFPYEEGRPVPAHTLSSASGLYFLSMEDESPAVYKLSKVSFSGGDFHFSKHYASFESETLASDAGRVATPQPQTSVPLAREVEYGDVMHYGSGSVSLIPAHRNICNAVVRDGYLWAVHEGQDNGDELTRAHWMQIRLSSPRAIVQRGVIGGGADNDSCACPLIAVNAAHDVMVGMTLSGAHTFPSAAYAVRLASDAPNTMRAPRVYKTGNFSKPEGPFYTSGGVTFWATGRALTDPADETGFWVCQHCLLDPSPYERAWLARVGGVLEPNITQQPQSVTVAPNGTAHFSLTATGSNLTYKWYHNDQELGGQSAPSLTVSGVNALKTGYYRCLVRNSAAEIWSEEVALSLTTGNPGVFSFINSDGDDTENYTFGEAPDLFHGEPVEWKALRIRRRNGSDGRVRVAVNVRGAFIPPVLGAWDGWDFREINTAPPRSRFFHGPGALTFEPGQTQKTILLYVPNDTMVEPQIEAAKATLAADSATGAAVATPEAAVYIADDDFGLTLAQALDTNLTLSNEDNDWKPQRTTASDGIDAAQCDFTVPGMTRQFSTAFAEAGTLVFRWRSQGADRDRLQLLRFGDVVNEIGGATEWQTVSLAIADPGGLRPTSIQWRFVRGAGTTDAMATAFVDRLQFFPGTAGAVEFAQGGYTVNENAGTVSVTVRRLGHTATFGTISVSLQNGTALGGSDYQTQNPGILQFFAGQTTRTISFNVLPDTVTEPTETFRAVLTPTGGGGITVGPQAGTTISILDDTGITYASWGASVFTPAQLANPAVSGATADPDRDGATNLSEYAADTLPLSGASLPLTTAATDGPPGEDPGHLTLTFKRRKNSGDLTYTVQRATTLGAWQDGAVFAPGGTGTFAPGVLESVSATGGPVETRTVRDAVPVASGRTFLRVIATVP